jgi:hypothetical protein
METFYFSSFNSQKWRCRSYHHFLRSLSLSSEPFWCLSLVSGPCERPERTQQDCEARACKLLLERGANAGKAVISVIYQSQELVSLSLLWNPREFGSTNKYDGIWRRDDGLRHNYADVIHLISWLWSSEFVSLESWSITIVICHTDFKPHIWIFCIDMK